MHRLVAVDHDARRILAALVRVAQLDAPAVHQRRLMHRHRLLERASELRRAHLSHRRFVGADQSPDELADARAVTRGNEMHRRERHEIELQRELAANLVALVHGNAVPLVHGEEHGAAALQRETEHACVLLAHLFVRIEHENHDVRIFDGLQRLRDADALDDVFHFRATTHARGVDEQ